MRNLCEGAWHSCLISKILLPMAMFVVDGVIAKNTAQEHGPWSMRRLHTFEASMGDSIKLQRLTKFSPNLQEYLTRCSTRSLRMQNPMTVSSVNVPSGKNVDKRQKRRLTE